MRHLVWIPLALLSSCGYWFFSAPNPLPDFSRPVVRVETQGGVELGASTEYGILFLGRTAQDGPCRVHYFLGPTPVVEDGTIVSAGGYYLLADIDLKAQDIPILDRPVAPEDRLVAMFMAGTNAVTVPVSLASDPDVAGSVLNWPDASLPAGTAILVQDESESFRFVGLVSGEAELETDAGTKRFVVFAGTEMMRENLLIPQLYPVDERIVVRPDDITVIK